MRKYYFYFSVLTVLVITALGVGFWLGGSPLVQKALSYDSQRISTMSSLKYSIDSYYQQNGELPKSLNELQDTPTTTDPETKNPFDYKIVDKTSYSLCTTFSSDTKDASYQDRNYNTSIAGITFYHSKGYDCIQLKVLTSYAKPDTSVPANGGWQSLLGTYLGTVDSVALSTDEPKMIIKIENVDKIIFLKDAKSFNQVLNKNGSVIPLEDFQVGDKVIIDTTFTQNGMQYKASQIQNLSR